MWIMSALILFKAMQMRDFMNKSDQKSIFVQIVIDCNSVSFPRAERQVVAKFGGPPACYFQMNIFANHPFRALRNSRCRKVFGKDRGYRFFGQVKGLYSLAKIKDYGKMENSIDSLCTSNPELFIAKIIAPESPLFQGFKSWKAIKLAT